MSAPSERKSSAPPEEILSEFATVRLSAFCRGLRYHKRAQQPPLTLRPGAIGGMRPRVRMKDAGEPRLETADRDAQLLEGERGGAAARELVVARHAERAAERVGDDLRPQARGGERRSGGDEMRDRR